MPTVTDQKHSFYATLTAVVEIEDIDFYLLMDCCKNHYDAKVQSLVIPGYGAILNGSLNRRTGASEKDINIEFSTRQLNLCMKALEQYYPSDKNQAKFFLSNRLHKIFDELQEKQQEINKKLGYVL